jgi:muconolactone delta-isomerase
MLFLVHGRFDMDALASVDVEELGAREGNRVAALYQEGVILRVWRRADRTGAVLVFDCDSEDEVRDVLNSMPAFAYSREVEITPLVTHPLFPQFGVSDCVRA